MFCELAHIKREKPACGCLSLAVSAAEENLPLASVKLELLVRN